MEGHQANNRGNTQAQSTNSQKKNRQQEIKQNKAKALQVANIRLNKAHKFLNLTNCPLVWDQVLNINKQSADWHTLLYLRLDSCKINKQSIIIMKELKWLTLIQLNLHENNIGNCGVKHLCKAELLQVKKINLQKCDIGDEGAKHIIKAYWPKVKQINLSINPIGLQGKLYLNNAYVRKGQGVSLSQQIKADIAMLTNQYELRRLINNNLEGFHSQEQFPFRMHFVIRGNRMQRHFYQQHQDQQNYR